MVSEYTRYMGQDATYWGPPTRDAFDVLTFPAPTPISVRWEDKAVLFRDAEGQQVMSEAVVYTAQQVETDGFLYLGTSAAVDPQQVDGAAEIRQTGRTLNLRATKRLNKAML